MVDARVISASTAYVLFMRNAGPVVAGLSIAAPQRAAPSPRRKNALQEPMGVRSDAHAIVRSATMGPALRMNRTYAVDADITRASTIDSAFYHSDASYAAARAGHTSFSPAAVRIHESH